MPLLLVSITAAGISQEKNKNDKGEFHVGPVTDYAHRQTSEKVTIAAQPFVTDTEAAEAFGKINPYRLGMLPVLIVIQNDGPDAIQIDRAKFQYELPDDTRIDATPASDVRYAHSVRPPSRLPGGSLPGVWLAKKKEKNPLDEWEIEGRSLAAKMIPAGQSASGFVYFQSPVASSAASVSISGIRNPVTGKELLYFEIPMSEK